MNNNSKCQHCPHPVGSGFATGHSRSEAVRCCHCGILGWRTYHFEDQLVSDHGPFYKRHVEVLDTLKWQDPPQMI